MSLVPTGNAVRFEIQATADIQPFHDLTPTEISIDGCQSHGYRPGTVTIGYEDGTQVTKFLYRPLLVRYSDGTVQPLTAADTDFFPSRVRLAIARNTEASQDLNDWTLHRVTVDPGTQPARRCDTEKESHKVQVELSFAVKGTENLDQEGL